MSANPVYLATSSTGHPNPTPPTEPFRVDEPNPSGTGMEPTQQPSAGPPHSRMHSHSIRLTATIRTQPASQPPHPTNNNNGEFPPQTQNLFQMRDRLFLALFFRVSLIYARAVPKVLRRILEFLLLMQSIILLLTLAYIHIVYTQIPITCLDEYKETWPRDGILRVEITTEPAEDYSLAKSYQREERLRQQNAQAQMGHYSNDDLLSLMLTADSIILDKAVSSAQAILSSLTSYKSSDKEAGEAKAEPNSPIGDDASGAEETLKASEELYPENSFATDEIRTENEEQIEEPTESEASNTKLTEFVTASGVCEDEPKEVDQLEGAAANEEKCRISPSVVDTASGEGSSTGVGMYYFVGDVNNPDSPYFNMTKEEIEIVKEENRNKEGEPVLKSSALETSSTAWNLEHAYIVEYSHEYGFLRLTPPTRQRLNISVKIVTLNPRQSTCFGNNLSRFLLDHFLGYDDVLMSSIKSLAENEENKGYLRNVVTGEQFRFVPMWMARSAYLPAMLIMLVFTVSISMLLRYSHHQIFVFIVDLLNNVEGNGSIHIPAAPLFTVILALVGMEAIMSEFFNDTSTAFYVILIVWIADQYDSVCCHTTVTRTYWVRFFYLYHFVFYAYHYRFNGQYGGLALLVSWSFIQHSMVYFYHHYELPTILRQAHQGEEQGREHRTPTNSPRSTSSSLEGNAGSTASTPNEESMDQRRRPTFPGTSSPSPSPSSSGSESSGGGNSFNLTTLSAELTFTRTNETVSTTTPESPSGRASEGEPSQRVMGGLSSNFLTAPNVASGFGLRLRNALPTSSSNSDSTSGDRPPDTESSSTEPSDTVASAADELD